MAQKDSIYKILGNIEKNSPQELDINKLLSLLDINTLSDTQKIAIQTTIVHTYQKLKKWDNGIAYCQEQIKIAHQQKKSIEEATFYKLIGDTYYYIPQKKNAIDYWKKSIAIAEPNNYKTLLTKCYHNVGVISLEESKFSEAENYFIKAIDLSKKNNDTSSSTYILHYRLLATTYQAQNKLDKAEQLFLSIIAKSRKAKDSSNLVESLLFYTDVLNKKKEFNKAVVVSEEALAIARKINLIDGLITALSTHSANLMAYQNYKDAYSYKQEEDSLIKVRYQNDLNTKISEAEAKFKTTEIQHEKDLAFVKAKKEKQLYLVAFTSLLLIGGFSIYTFYQKRSTKQKLQLQIQLQEEKERLSRDLHDNLGSQMALLSNTIETLYNNQKKQLSITENINNVKTTSKQLLQTLRETIWILNKEQITAHDFFDKLIDYTSRYLQSYDGIKLSVQENINEQKLIPSNDALQVFRICQEAVNNTCKYADTKEIQIKGNLINNSLSFTIKDFGKGFAINKVDSKEHYGIKNMQQRAASIGATLDIVSNLNEGTEITIKLK